MLYLVFVIITLIWLLFASVFDIKTREIPNWLSFSLIAIGLGGRLIYSFIESDYGYFFHGLIWFGVFFLLANIMYYTKQWGGGDGKLLMGLGTMFGDYQNVFEAKFIFPFLIEFIINLAVAGAILGLGWSIFLAVKNNDRFMNTLKASNLKLISLLFLVLIILSYIPSLFIKELIIFSFVLPLLGLIVIFVQFVDKSCMYKYLKPNELTEGDWIAENVKINNKIIVGPKNVGITKEQIEIIKKHKIKQVLIKQGIPFVPAFLFGFIITVYFGNLALYFF